LRLRFLAVGLALFCVWFDFTLREPPRPQLASYEWRRTVSGWEELPRWEAPPEPTPARPFLFASVLLGATAVALSLPFISKRPGRAIDAAHATAGS